MTTRPDPHESDHPSEREWLEGLRYEDKYPDSHSGQEASMQTDTKPATTVEVHLVGTAPGAELHEVSAALWAIPRKGDLISAWVGDLTGEVYARVEEVSWPAWQYAHDPGVQVPTVQVGREDMSDEEWADFFESIRERRHP